MHSSVPYNVHLILPLVHLSKHLGACIIVLPQLKWLFFLMILPNLAFISLKWHYAVMSTLENILVQ